jgi:hypothetical protein
MSGSVFQALTSERLDLYVAERNSGRRASGPRLFAAAGR